MNELQIFNHVEFGNIRTLTIDGVPWFVGKDVATVLGYSNTRDALSKHIEAEDKRGSQIATPSGIQEMTIINESGLYSLILSSKLETAKRFKRWVTSEVLPSIHKHGAYVTRESLQQVILNPDTMIRLATALKEEQVKNKQLEAENASLTVENTIMQPKAEYFDELVDRNLLTNFRETAKQLEVREKDFIRFLLDKKYLCRDQKGKLMPCADKNNGLFTVKECFHDKTSRSGTQTLVTPKGRETFRLLYLQNMQPSVSRKQKENAVDADTIKEILVPILAAELMQEQESIFEY